MSNESRDPVGVAHPVSRRTVLATAVAGGAVIAAASLGWWRPAQAAAAAARAASEGAQDTAFLHLSRFLTGKPDLNPVLSQRYFAALGRHVPGFAAALAQLQQVVASTQAPDVDALVATPGLEAGVQQTIRKIVSAWYLGIVGDDEHVELIAYAEALMYVPCEGALVVPTYGSGPDSWGEKPVLLHPRKAVSA